MARRKKTSTAASSSVHDTRVSSSCAKASSTQSKTQNKAAVLETNTGPVEKPEASVATRSKRKKKPVAQETNNADPVEKPEASSSTQFKRKSKAPAPVTYTGTVEKPVKKTSKGKAKNDKVNEVVNIPTKPVGNKTGKKAKGKEKAETGKSKHLLDDKLYEDCLTNIDLAVDNEVCMPASGVSVEASHHSVGQDSSRDEPFSLHFECSVCDKILTTIHGYKKHIMAHRLVDANKGRPSADALLPLVESIIMKALEDIKEEYGEHKNVFVEGVLKSTSSVTWHKFTIAVAEPYLKSLSQPIKLMPSNQYEEQLKALNTTMNDRETFSELLVAFKSLYPDNEPQLPERIPAMILFRVCSKLVDALSEFVFREMKAKKESDTSTLFPPRQMSEIEKEAFSLHIRKLLQKYYMRGLRQGSGIWLSRCACIRQKFIDCELSDPPSVDMVLSEKAWEHGDLKLNGKCLDFFSSLEGIIENLIFRKVYPINCDSVTPLVLKNIDMLDIWHYLTLLFLSEIEALVFMSDLLTALIELSLRLEVGRMVSSDVESRTPKYALRTDLKRN